MRSRFKTDPAKKTRLIVWFIFNVYDRDDDD